MCLKINLTTYPTDINLISCLRAYRDAMFRKRVNVMRDSRKLIGPGATAAYVDITCVLTVTHMTHVHAAVGARRRYGMEIGRAIRSPCQRGYVCPRANAAIFSMKFITAHDLFSAVINRRIWVLIYVRFKHYSQLQDSLRKNASNRNRAYHLQQKENMNIYNICINILYSYI